MCSVALSDDVWAFSTLQLVLGSNLEPDTDVGPVDLWMHSLLSDVSVSVIETLVSPPTSMRT
jgi:hypothetical protein